MNSSCSTSAGDEPASGRSVRRAARNFATLATRERELGPRTWERTRRLCLWRPDEHYAAGAFWNADGTEFLGWYVDVIDPLRRSPIGFDFRDLALDIVIGEDLTWAWKDQAEVDLAVELGMLTSDEAIRSADAGGGRRADRARRSVVDVVAHWATDPSWPIPTLPDGWDVL